ncbi:MAG TPA: aspartyl protease family protein [Candidatus Sulfotelmatobacter sp.]|nr:aspartyl protease family protein [Candidatus Sulfotelmatobacter sp.]
MVARMVGTIALIALALFGMSGTPVAADDAAALLAKHRAYVGWQDGDGSITSLRESGTETRGDTVVARLTHFRRGIAYRNVYERRQQVFQNGFTGRVLWTSNENGFTVQSVGEPARYAATDASLFGEGLGDAPATVLRAETLDGTAVTWVHLAPAVGVPVDVAIDPSTGAFKHVVLDPGGDYETALDILGYTDVGGGKRVISSWRYRGTRPIYAYTSVTANAPVSDAELHPPAPRATWSFDPAMGTVPVELTEERITVDAVVNGVKGHFFLDTGASSIVLTDTFARRANAHRITESRIVGIGGGVASNVYQLDTIAFGNSTLRNVAAYTGIDEEADAWRGFDGVIGFDLFAGAIVDLNLDQQTLRILDPTRFEPDKSVGFVVPVDLTSGQPRVPMRAGGRVPVLATLDSGSPALVLFSTELQSRDHVAFIVDPTSLMQEAYIVGVNGRELDKCGKLQSLQLGPIVYQPVPACASPSMGHSDVLVGLEFLRAFNITFDYPDGYLVLRKR